MAKQKHVVIIGAGFSGLSAAAYLGKAGFKVTVIEQNPQPGGRAIAIRKKGFRFDLGPSWYVAPEIFEGIFADFDKKPTDYYKLDRLDPHYRVFFSGGRHYDLSTPRENATLFSQLEPGAGVELERFLAKSRYIYESFQDELLNTSLEALSPLLRPKRLNMLRKMPLLRSYHSVIASHFQDPRLQQILEYLTIFLGRPAKKTPALFMAMVYAEMSHGLWYPQGGFLSVAKAFEKLGKSYGVEFKYRTKVKKIEVNEGKAVAVKSPKRRFTCDYVIAACDYQYAEMQLLDSKYRSYSPRYWNNKKYTPSALLINLGFDTKLSNLEHHNIFLDTNFNKAVNDIFTADALPAEPIFQVTVPTKSDEKLAKKDGDSLTVYIPIANNLREDKIQLDALKQNVYERIGEQAQLDISKHLIFEECRSVNYFSESFNATRGSAAGLSQGILQSAIYRPNCKSKKVGNLFYAGQDTNPGMGVPLCLISGKNAAMKLQQTV